MCWGSGAYFNLGEATTANAPTPVVVGGTAGTRAVVLGHRHACAIDVAGSALCWGRNQYGQLGLDNLVDRSTPTLVPGVAPLRGLSAAGSDACALEMSGDVRCWGANTFGQLGVGDLVPHPYVKATVVSNATKVATHSTGACALLMDGAMTCWGDGPPDLGGVASTPRRSQLANVTDVIAGVYHMCAIADGALTCWGSNGNGELGRGEASITSDREVMLAGAISDYSLGPYHACALVNGQAYCWGANELGQIGDGTLAPALAPRLVATGLSSVAGVSVGEQHSCAWGGGSVACWGNSESGRVGVPAGADLRQPTPVIVVGASAVAGVAAGALHTCAITGTTVSCWGSNLYGQLGDNSSTSSPAPVTAIGVTNPTKIASGAAYSCALAAGQAWCWGANISGQLGDGTKTDRHAPIMVNVPNGPVVDIALAGQNTCAITSAGEVYCWGGNANGNLGVGDTIERLVPTRVAGLPAAVEITVGGFGACARVVTGQVFCWGGDVDLVPVENASFSGMTNIQRDLSNSCGTKDGKLHCNGGALIAGDVQTATRDLTGGAPAAIPPCN